MSVQLDNTFIFSVDFAGGVGLANSQKGDPLITQALQASLFPLAKLFELEGADPPGSPSEVAAFYLQVKRALWGGGSVDVILSGGSPGTVEVPGLYSFGNGIVENGERQLLSQAQLEALDALIDSLESVGFTSAVESSLDSTFREKAIAWSQLANLSQPITTIFQRAVDTSQQTNRSLQAMVELIYVRQANEILTESMAGLKEALEASRDVISILTDLQEIKNILEVDPDTEPASIEERLAGATFGTDDVVEEFQEGLVAGGWLGISSEIEEQLELVGFKISSDFSEPAEAEELIFRFGGLFEKLENVVGKLEASGFVPEEDSIIGAAQRLLDDFSELRAIFDNPFASPFVILSQTLSAWVGDNYTSTDPETAIKSGDFQRNLSRAITAAENFNDSQKERVRQQLFIFEEYYKSAAAILSKVSQLIEKMAQAIAR